MGVVLAGGFVAGYGWGNVVFDQWGTLFGVGGSWVIGNGARPKDG